MNTDTVVIGDVHGCLDELLALVQRCGGTRQSRFVLVGDLVAKGPDSAGVVQWARESRVSAVLGNHDAHVLRLKPGGSRAAAFLPAKSPVPKQHHVAVAETLQRADWTWLDALPLWYEVDAAKADNADNAANATKKDETPWLVVHAGLVRGVPLDEQKPEYLLTLRSITPDGQPSKKIESAPWASVWTGPPHVVFGHDAVRGLQQHEWATGLDTGCVYGNRLTALVLPKGELVSVPARRAYATM